ncbi:NUMOD4 domain-containing protein [Bradyrhizobium sp. LVM 105]|uniref:NUMOD4 domain-containing protein n=1 Tax=Bradyrhizobium sp. LVM 105 TaxID=2341115 RepID=UPI000F815AC8|nr:NUMOD4 domain-containing protein [Bradyrhizobium sp. LVM 105]RTE91928.1 hypothetical protein D6B98_16065 [Bradyrhizobium sp. LVM 105]
METEFRPVPGYEGLYELSRDGRLFAVERKILQVDTVGRKFFKTIKRHEKAATVNGRGYRGFNLHKNNKQTCRLISTLLRETFGENIGSVT